MRLTRVLVLLVLGGGFATGCKADDCQLFVDRSKPVLSEMGKSLGKPIPDSMFDDMVQECRKADKRDPIVDCVLGASNQDGVIECWKQGFQEYSGQ